MMLSLFSFLGGVRPQEFPEPRLAALQATGFTPT